ncbi:MAG: hypothetical protein HY216_04135, partial [Candidatus Rokubacteria bacterium]|nr:hypothetical protein [Candidatus Rokubacteria bacterium]
MRCRTLLLTLIVLVVALVAVASAQKGAPPSTVLKLGTVVFPTSCSGAAQAKFVRGVALLHSFWFDAAAAAFTDAAKTDPTCGIAWWGVAMTALGNPLAAPPSPRALLEGRAAVDRARGAGVWVPRERDYIEAIALVYTDTDRLDHRTRLLAYAKAMEALAAKYPADREASIFHALALDATALPGDKTYANQLRAAGILERIFAEQPQHPGVAHYIIHSYDYPPIAEKGLDAARRYAAIAPSAPHALHMPSHIFTRRGYWKESIDANRASARAAKDAGNRLHALDYLAYAHLQRAEDAEARKVLEEARGLGAPKEEYLAVPFALAAIPARYAAIAPSAPHALHMPSHIFTRRGYWKESIDAN